jgi:hypothetical protein
MSRDVILQHPIPVTELLRVEIEARLLAGIAIVLAFATCASADISWTFSDVNFYLGTWSASGTVYTEVASLTGSFSTNDAVTTGHRLFGSENHGTKRPQ